MTEQTEKVRVLFISASPEGLSEIAQDREYKAIEAELLQKGALRERFTLRGCTSASRLEIAHCVEEFQPHIIHFTAHGEADGLVVVDGSVSGVADQLDVGTLEHFVRGAETLVAVVLNACSSETLAGELQSRLPALAVVGTTRMVSEEEALAFSCGFYASLARGRPLARAVRAGSASIPHSSNGNAIYRGWGPGLFKVTDPRGSRLQRLWERRWPRRLALVPVAGLAVFLLATRAPVLQLPPSQTGEWRPTICVLVDPESSRALDANDREYLTLALGGAVSRPSNPIATPIIGGPQTAAGVKRDPLESLEETFREVLAEELPMFVFVGDDAGDAEEATAKLVLAVDPEASGRCGVVDGNGLTIEAHIEVSDGERLRSHFALCMTIEDADVTRLGRRNLVADSLLRRLREMLLRGGQGGLDGFAEVPFLAEYKVAPWRREVLSSRLLAETKFGERYEQFARDHVRMSVKDESGERQTFLVCDPERVSGPLVPAAIIDDVQSCDDVPWNLWFPRRFEGESIFLDEWTPLPWSER